MNNARRHTHMYKFHTRRQWETRNFMSRAGPVRAVVRPGVTYRLGAPVGPENTSEGGGWGGGGGGGGGGGYPLRLAKLEIRFSFYTSVHSTCTFKLHTTV